ncbi:Retinoblastoma-binding-like protein E [Galdieria sulphuraria]|nr:Retinoblastoma-binding-like protein E [Galdieria sulphuraria]
MLSTVVGIVVAVVVAFTLMGVLFLLAYFIERKLNNFATRRGNQYSLPLTGMVGRRGAVVIGAIRPVQRTQLDRTVLNHPKGLTVEQLDAISPAHTFGEDTKATKISTELTVEYYENEEKVGTRSSCDFQERPTPAMDTKEKSETKVEATNNDYCAICLEEFGLASLVRRLPCHHVFHSQELERWFAKSSFCPICRVDVTPSEEQTTTTTNAV